MKPEKDSQEQLLKRLERQVEELSANLERTRLAEYVQLLDNPRRLLHVNFLVGISGAWGGAGSNYTGCYSAVFSAEGSDVESALDWRFYR